MRRVKAKGPSRRIIEKAHRINEKITVDLVRLIRDGEEPKIIKTYIARSIAKDEGLDLIEISNKSEPPICKIYDYNKFLYEQKKRDKAAKEKQTIIKLKEVRFGPTTGAHDIDFKRKHTEEFLKEGNKVKAFVFFKGRSIVHKDLGEILLRNFAESLKDKCKIDQYPKMEGKKMFMILSPK